MKCYNCGKVIPDGSTFCTYCGTSFSSAQSSEEESPFLKLANGDEEAAKFLMSMFVQNRVDKQANIKKNYEKSHSSVHTNAYGSMNEPIYVDDIEGEKKFLARLTDKNGKKLTWTRKGSQDVEGIDGVLDIYVASTSDGKEYGELWINMYSDAIPTVAPVGYILDGDKSKTVGYQPPQKVYIKTAQATAENTSKEVIKTTTTKQKFNPVVIIMGIALVGTIIFAGKLFYVNKGLSQQINNLSAEIVGLQEKKETTEKELREVKGKLMTKEAELTLAEKEAPKDDEVIISDKYLEELDFFHENAVIVPDDGMNRYHYFGCKDLDLSYFWIYNPEAAERDGYSLCPVCKQLKESKRSNVYNIYRNSRPEIKYRSE